MAFRLLDMAQQRWRRLDGAHVSDSPERCRYRGFESSRSTIQSVSFWYLPENRRKGGRSRGQGVGLADNLDSISLDESRKF